MENEKILKQASSNLKRAKITIDEIRELIKIGEKIDVEFKESKTALTKDVFDTVCSFSNRTGGHILLGINDQKEIVGVNEDKIDKIIKDFTNCINSPQKIYPPLYLIPEVFDIDGKKIIYIKVPEGTQVYRHNGRIWDRSYEGDINITDHADLVFKLYARKQNSYFVNKVYPNLDISFLDSAVIEKARKMAVVRNENHAWGSMNNEELLRSANLILVDPDTKREGITLAAILLFGKENTIMSILPQHKTDAIFRVENKDRYDDRDVVTTNLIDSYERLISFGQKHLNDLFVLDGIVNVNARDRILREIVSNTLAHRDYSSGFPSKMIIDDEKIVIENSNLSHGIGPLDIQKFEPFPKNPSISKVFREIGLADELGSGMRNTYKYTQLYSKQQPLFEEGDIFRTIIPLKRIATKRVGGENVPQDVPQDVPHDVPHGKNELTNFIIEQVKSNNKITRQELAKKAKVSVKTVQRALSEIDDLKYVGSGNNGYWERMCVEIDTQGDTQDDTQGDTQDDTQEKILRMIKTNPKVSTADIAEELGLGIATVKRKIKKIPNISYVGSGYSGHWERVCVKIDTQDDTQGDAQDKNTLIEFMKEKVINNDRVTKKEIADEAGVSLKNHKRNR